MHTVHKGIVSRLFLEEALYFTHPDHLKSIRDQEQHILTYLWTEGKAWEGYFPVVWYDDKAISLPQAPFGSFQLNAGANNVHTFISFILNDLKNKGIHQLVVKHFPTGYPNGFLLHDVLSSLPSVDYQVLINHHIYAAPDWSECITKYNRQRIVRHIDEYQYCCSTSMDEMASVYDFIRSRRQEKGYTLSLTLDQMLNIKAHAQDRLMVHYILKNKEMAAANISFRLNDHILYVYQHAHLSRYEKESPLAILMHHMVESYPGHIIDLGHSHDPDTGSFNASLGAFKAHLGGEESQRNIYTITL